MSNIELDSHLNCKNVPVKDSPGINFNDFLIIFELQSDEDTEIEDIIEYLMRFQNNVLIPNRKRVEMDKETYVGNSTLLLIVFSCLLLVIRVLD